MVWNQESYYKKVKYDRPGEGGDINWCFTTRAEVITRVSFYLYWLKPVNQNGKGALKASNLSNSVLSNLQAQQASIK